MMWGYMSMVTCHKRETKEHHSERETINLTSTAWTVERSDWRDRPTLKVCADEPKRVEVESWTSPSFYPWSCPRGVPPWPRSTAADENTVAPYF
eukprot:scaffold34695_cov266-Amphora_coffeaeformis.AAC.6